MANCDICSKEMTHPFVDDDSYFGNNADPILDGRCCDWCDCTLVIPTRMGQGAELGLMLLKARIEHWVNCCMLDETEPQGIEAMRYIRKNYPNFLAMIETRRLEAE